MVYDPKRLESQRAAPEGGGPGPLPALLASNSQKSAGRWISTWLRLGVELRLRPELF